MEEGINIIGIYPGEKFYTSEDKILVVGAHWDTTAFTDGYNDNGSGAQKRQKRIQFRSESGQEYTVAKRS